MTTSITFINHQSSKTYFNLTQRQVMLHILGPSISDITILLKVNGVVELFDFSTVFNGNGLCTRVFEEALALKIKGMEYKYEK